jgi:hypothetical protein
LFLHTNFLHGRNDVPVPGRSGGCGTRRECRRCGRAPPPGFKIVRTDHKITTEKDQPDYEFFTVLGKDVTPVKFDAKTPAAILAKDHRGPRFMGRAFVAVPTGAAKKYDDEKEFYAAIAAGKVEGQVKAKQVFYAQQQVKDAVQGDTIVLEYKLDKIDAKDGIVLSKKDESKKEGGKDSPDDGDDAPDREPVASAPRGGMWVAGLAGFAAVMLGGLWLAGRARRKV